MLDEIVFGLQKLAEIRNAFCKISYRISNLWSFSLCRFKRRNWVVILLFFLGIAPLWPSMAADATMDSYGEAQRLGRNSTQVSDVFGQNQTVSQAVNITQRILKTYPPERYHYIFVGRSLTLIKVIMDSMGVSNTGLPFRGKTFDLTFSSADARNNADLIKAHLDKHLPRASERNGKELVLLDYTNSGAGLNTAQKVLDWYYGYKERLNLLRVTTNPLSLSSVTPSFLNQYHSKSIRISAESMFARHLLNSNFDAYAGYGTFNISSGRYLDYDEHTRARYDGFKSWITSEVLGPKAQGRNRCMFYLSTH